MNPGDKIVLHKNLNPGSKTDTPDTFAIVTITEIRDDVPGMFQPKEKHRGFKGTDEQGREFSCNWSSFPDDCMTPCWGWNGPGREWYDLSYVRGAPGLPQSLVESDVVAYCKEHKTIYYPGHKECFNCSRPAVVKTEKKTWNGW